MVWPFSYFILFLFFCVASLPLVEPMCDFKERWVDVGKRLWVPSFDELLRLADGKDPADEKDPKSSENLMSLNRAKEFLDQSNLLGSHVFRIWKLTMTGKERLCITEFVCFFYLFF